MLFHLQFAGFMAVGMVIMLIFGIIVTVGRNKVIYLSSYGSVVILFSIFSK